MKGLLKVAGRGGRDAVKGLSDRTSQQDRACLRPMSRGVV